MKIRILLALIVTLPALGRVVSYAPYSSNVSLSGYHERSSRWFVVIERPSRSDFDRRAQVLLHDSTDEFEPRVIYPLPDANGGVGTATVEYVALYERKAEGSDRRPLLLLGGGNQTKFSADGGATWKPVLLNGTGTVEQPRDYDVGGPFVRGMSSQIFPGNDRYPFIVAFEDLGIHVIDASGKAKALFPAGTQLVGRNAAADRFVIRWNDQLRLLDLDGNSSVLGRADASALYSGWIRRDGAVYLQMVRPEGRFLFLHERGVQTFIMGTRGVGVPDPDDEPWEEDAPPLLFLAAPTHDFEGAWIMQRNPTTLSRHSAAGLETMWSDPLDPEVEALIAGASGETLLVQVHRPRPVMDAPQVQRPIDPAIAVWRIGDPRPFAYDELYLREMWNKCFVHVDVDRIASGDPFVFDSGFSVLITPPPPISSAPPGGADVIQEWGIVRASLKQRLVLPGVARLRGTFDSFWLTDVILHNPFDDPQEIEVFYVPTGETRTPSGRRTIITLGANEIREIPDALRALYGVESGSGVLHFHPTDGISVTARTYSRNANGGTFGYGINAIDFYNAAGPRFPLTFSGAFPGAHFRTNLLLADTSSRGTEVELRAFDRSGAVRDTAFTIAGPASGVGQHNGLAPSLGLLDDESGGLTLQPKRGTVIAGLVAIDNRTNDPTYFPPDLATDIARFIPVIGHVEGANGSSFRSDLYLFNAESTARTVALQATQWGTGTQRTVQFTMLAKEARVIPDALMTLFTMTGMAHLRYSGGVRVTSRTYNLEASGATYGCLIPPLNGFQMATSGETLEILGASIGNALRTNLGLVELSGAANVTVTVEVIDFRGRQRETILTTVPRSGVQLNDLLRTSLLPAGPVRILVKATSGTIGAYATLTDNVTNDSTYLAAQLGARPD